MADDSGVKCMKVIWLEVYVADSEEVDLAVNHPYL